MRMLVPVIALVCAVGSAQSQPRAEVRQNSAITVLGEGLVICGTYLEHRAERKETQDYVYFTWVRGYVTGRNQSAKRLNVAGLEEAVVLAYLDKYCRDNPLNGLIGAASKLYQEVGGER